MSGTEQTSNRYVKLESWGDEGLPQYFYYEIDPKRDVPRLIHIWPDGYTQWDATASHESLKTMFGYYSCIEGPWEDWTYNDPEKDPRGVMGKDISQQEFEEVWKRAVQTGHGPYNDATWR